MTVLSWVSTPADDLYDASTIGRRTSGRDMDGTKKKRHVESACCL
jgi:hypothetical protein